MLLHYAHLNQQPRFSEVMTDKVRPANHTSVRLTNSSINTHAGIDSNLIFFSHGLRFISSFRFIPNTEINRCMSHPLIRLFTTSRHLLDGRSNVFIQSPLRRITIISPILIHRNYFVVFHTNERYNMK